MSSREDYLTRVYAGVLGKIIGVYVGRPFEGWSHERIMAELGPVRHFVNERFDQPLIVTDDDIAGTFTFCQALEEHGAKPDLSAAEIGQTWLNRIVENRTILWWGGNGTSTEHTAWLNLKRGIAAPRSGAAAVNGAALAEQIGAQIFVEGWALVAPGQPRLAARLAEQAARVSHDGEAVHAAMLIAAMEAEAFVADDMDHLIDTGLSVIPADCLIARLIADLRAWHREEPDWRATRRRIEERYGYDRYPGICHVVPNHALVIMTLLYAPNSFHDAMTIVNTSGWDTDCNAGNVGALLGIKLGLGAFTGGPDWRGPVADRLYLSSADGGGAVTDAVRVSVRLAALGYRLSGVEPPAPPKQGAPYHFTLPGSVQGFEVDPAGHPDHLRIANDGGRLRLDLTGSEPAPWVAAITPTFSPPEAARMRSYELMACPQVSSGQRLEALCQAASENTQAVSVGLRVKIYGRDDMLIGLDGPAERLSPGESVMLTWLVPDTGGQPIQAVGIRLGGTEAATVYVDHVRWTGAPNLRLRRPDVPCDFWRRAWVNGVTTFAQNLPASFRISQDLGEGLIIHGTRDWRDYAVQSDITIHLGSEGGVAFRVQGLRRFYALLLCQDGMVRLIRARDGKRSLLAEARFDWILEQPYALAVTACGNHLQATIDGCVHLEAHDETYADGAMGLLINAGALSTDEIHIGPA